MTDHNQAHDTFATLFSLPESGKRPLIGNIAKIAIALSIAIAFFHLYVALIPSVSELMRNILHFAGFALLCAMTYPIVNKPSVVNSRLWLLRAIAL